MNVNLEACGEVAEQHAARRGIVYLLTNNRSFQKRILQAQKFLEQGTRPGRVEPGNKYPTPNMVNPRARVRHDRALSKIVKLPVVARFKPGSHEVYAAIAISIRTSPQFRRQQETAQRLHSAAVAQTRV